MWKELDFVKSRESSAVAPGQMLGLHAVRRRSGDARGGGVKGFVIRNLSAKKKRLKLRGKKSRRSANWAQLGLTASALTTEKMTFFGERALSVCEPDLRRGRPGRRTEGREVTGERSLVFILAQDECVGFF